jgi:hypothetical protein
MTCPPNAPEPADRRLISALSALSVYLSAAERLAKARHDADERLLEAISAAKAQFAIVADLRVGPEGTADRRT